MEIVFKRNVGRYRKGKTAAVKPALAKLLVKTGRAEYAKPTKVVAPKKPDVDEQVNVDEKPRDEVKQFETDLGGFRKAELVSIAVSEGVELDSTETKADLIAKIEKQRRNYLRRDMQAE